MSPPTAIASLGSSTRRNPSCLSRPRIVALWFALSVAAPACSESSTNQTGGTGGLGEGSSGAGAAMASSGGSGASYQSGGDTGVGGQATQGSGGQGTGGGGQQDGGSGGAIGTGGTGTATSGGAPASAGADTSGGASSSGGTASGGASASGGTAQTGGAEPSGGSAAAGAGGQEAGEPAVRFVGRMDTSDPAGPKFAWSGSGMIARFSGTSVSVNLSGGQEYAVVLDGEVKPKLTAASGSNAIAQGLSAGAHILELYRRTEANQGEAQFLGFDFGDGELLAPPAAPSRRLEIVGDSITCGYGNEGADRNCGFTPDTENHYLTYGAIAARDLGADLVTIAWSGKGVVCNYGDEADSCTNPMPTYYDRTLPDRADSAWDFSRYQPDAVVVNLGTNDVSTSQDPTQADFEADYEAFLLHIRSKNPNAFILCTNGPMLTGTELTTVQTYIDNVVQALNDAGDAKIGSFELTPLDSADGYGCNWHPSLTTHQKMAQELEAALKNALGW